MTQLYLRRALVLYINLEQYAGFKTNCKQAWPRK